jgi:hypothetical protein
MSAPHTPIVERWFVLNSKWLAAVDSNYREFLLAIVDRLLSWLRIRSGLCAGGDVLDLHGRIPRRRTRLPTSNPTRTLHKSA